MTKTRKALLALSLIICVLSLSACFDAHELNEQLHVLIIGIDQGIADKWRLTIQFLTVADGETGGGQPNQQNGEGAAPMDDIMTVDAPSFFAAIDLLNATRPERLMFSHAQFIIFSDELAKADLVKHYIAPINRFREIRRSARILVVKGSVHDYLQENQPLLSNLISEQMRLAVDEGENSGWIPSITLEAFNTALESPYLQPIAALTAVNDLGTLPKEGEPVTDLFLPAGRYIAGEIPRAGTNKIELFGTALFSTGRMVGELNGDETRYLLMVRDEFKRGFFTIQDPLEPGLIVPLDVRRSKRPKIKIELGEQPRIDLKVFLDLELLATQGTENYEDEALKGFLEEVFQMHAERGIEEVISTCQSLNIDPFLFGNQVVRHFWTIQELEAYEWPEKFKHAVVNVEVDAVIRRTGRKLRL